MKNLFSFRTVAFVILFLGLVLLADKVPIFKIYTAESDGTLVATPTNFTAIQLIAPIAGGLLQSTIGVAIVLLSQLISVLISGTPITLATITRLFTLAFATYYFAKAKESRWIKFAPLIAILAFIATTEMGGWHYSLLWIVPFICALPKFREVLFARALGSTLTAHAMGNLWFLIFFGPQPGAFWAALLPVTIIERIVMAAGITVSYVLVNAVLTKYFSDVPILVTEKKYALF